MSTTHLKMYQIDAFTDKVFAGNPAAVCPLQQWLPDEIMQQIGMENNLSETAFIVGGKGRYQIRWFTPEIEVDLCGHATVASSFVIFNFIEPDLETIHFESKSGDLTVSRSGDLITLDFPSYPSERFDMPEGLTEALGNEPVEILNSRRPLAIFDSEKQISDLQPDFGKLKALADIPAIIVTAPGDEVDFVSRFFAPKLGIDEDPVTGSAHCVLTPYWSQRLNKRQLHARQLSRRGGELWLEDKGDRTLISGRAVMFSSGEIHI